MDKRDSNEPKPAARAAEELARAAARSTDEGRRLWRLQWAQAFKRLAEIGAPKRRSGSDDGGPPED